MPKTPKPKNFIVTFYGKGSSAYLLCRVVYKGIDINYTRDGIEAMVRLICNEEGLWYNNQFFPYHGIAFAEITEG